MMDHHEEMDIYELCCYAAEYLQDMSAYEFSEWKMKGFSYEFLSERFANSNK